MNKIVTRILSSLLIISLCITIVPIEGQAAKKGKASCVIYVKTNSSQKTIEATARKIHKNLTNEKKIILKVKEKINEKKHHATIKKIRKTVGKINKQGVGFTYHIIKESRKYTYYEITDAKTYKYAQKFVKKLYSMTRKMIMNEETSVKFYNDYKKYNNLNTLQMHILYDKLCDRYQHEYEEVSGIMKPTTTPSIYRMRDEQNDSKLTKLSTKQEKDLIIKKEGVRNVEWSVEPIKYADFNTFNEFKERLKKYPKALKAVALLSKTGEHKSGSQKAYFNIELLFPEEQMPTVHIMQTKNFADLSQATQLYAIDKSGYFGCEFKGTQMNKALAKVQGRKKAYCMYYDSRHRTGKNEAQRIKYLYLGKASGVCMNFAFYESALFAHLTMEVYTCSSAKINHMYTVLKIKNTKGKTLWVPFDYGIGPSENLMVSKKIKNKYLKTEKMRYKLYLKGLKGAPGKKNFTLADFI